MQWNSDEGDGKAPSRIIFEDVETEHSTDQHVRGRAGKVTAD